MCTRVGGEMLAVGDNTVCCFHTGFATHTHRSAHSVHGAGVVLARAVARVPPLAARIEDGRLLRRRRRWLWIVGLRPPSPPSARPVLGPRLAWQSRCGEKCRPAWMCFTLDRKERNAPRPSGGPARGSRRRGTRAGRGGATRGPPPGTCTTQHNAPCGSASCGSVPNLIYRARMFEDAHRCGPRAVTPLHRLLESPGGELQAVPRRRQRAARLWADAIARCSAKKHTTSQTQT